MADGHARDLRYDRTRYLRRQRDEMQHPDFDMICLRCGCLVAPGYVVEHERVMHEGAQNPDDGEPDMDAYRLNPPPTVMDQWAEYSERY